MGRSPCCAKVGLKKGTWTLEEDRMLMAHIQQYGPGSWRALPAKAGLQRCGKSCRLRWTNYLRPDIKRGKISLQEEQTIIQLHALLGNRWSAIASHLPKRTDNEIKNYWNTHIKKRLINLGIDPMTHKPVNCDLPFGGSGNVCHMAQWESARLQAEARLARKSQTSDNRLSSNIRHYQPRTGTTFAPPSFPYLDVLNACQNQTGFIAAGAGSLESPTPAAAVFDFSDNTGIMNIHGFPENLDAQTFEEEGNYWNNVVLDLMDATNYPLF